jgi:hypothetical protein
VNDPQAALAGHCSTLLDMGLGDDLTVGAFRVRELARRDCATEHILDMLICQVGDRLDANYPQLYDALVDVQKALFALSGPDALPVTVAKIRDEDGNPIYRVDATSGHRLRLYAWYDAKGWESTGWGVGSFLDGVDPQPGCEDVCHAAWPVGLAGVVAKALEEES